MKAIETVVSSENNAPNTKHTANNPLNGSTKRRTRTKRAIAGYKDEG
jgi:hypothetical protein